MGQDEKIEEGYGAPPTVAFYQSAVPPSASHRDLGRRLASELSVVARPESSLVVGISTRASILCEEIARQLQIPSYNLCVEQIHHDGVIIGAISATCDQLSLDDDTIARLGLSSDEVMNDIHAARSLSILQGVALPPDQLWNRFGPGGNGDIRQTAFLTAAALVSSPQFKVAVDCMLARGIKQIVPVTPVLYKPAVFGAHATVRRGVYLRTLNDPRLL